MKEREEIKALTEAFKATQKVWIALGDEIRQHLILTMLEHGKDCEGMRVPELTQLTHLSRPAVSHHLQILKEAGIVNVRKEGTKNYYYFGSSHALTQLIAILEQSKKIVDSLPDRSEEKW